MVSTIKFSQFNAVNPDDTSVKYVGTGTGANVIGQVPFQWTISTRPLAPYNGLLGYNTDISQFEYWDSSTMLWTQLATNSTGLNWSTVTVASVDADANSGYIADRTSTPVQVVLPALFNIGDVIIVMGLGAGGWSLVCNAGQQIAFGAITTSVAGSISSTLNYDNISVRGLVANTLWEVVDGVGNLTIV